LRICSADTLPSPASAKVAVIDSPAQIVTALGPEKLKRVIVIVLVVIPEGRPAQRFDAWTIGRVLAKARSAASLGFTRQRMESLIVNFAEDRLGRMVGDDRFDVFLSYARSDEAAAVELNHWLCAQGLCTFFDRSELRPGLPWVPALEEAINCSRAVAILFGKHGIGNTQQYECQFALVRQTHEAAFPVIPVLMPGC
jgi:hypothetical protein